MASASAPLALFGCMAVTAIAAALGAAASVDAAAFYSQLAKPAWSPAAWLFGPVWTGLYVLMAVAAWLAWRAGSGRRRAVALALFVAQLAVNALWSWLFFRWHRGALAFADVLLLDALVLATTLAFWRLRPLAGALLLPYLGWIGFATALTWAVWQANPVRLG